jgi:hypothetical protein
VDDWLDQAWTDHAADPEGVWTRIPDAPLRDDPPQRRFRLAHLAAHVGGEHLGRWTEAEALLDRLAAPLDPGSPEGCGIRRLQGALAWASGDRARAEAFLSRAVPAGTPAGWVRGRMLAVAATTLTGRRELDGAFAAFEAALASAEPAPGPADPLARELAVAGNNLASALEERAPLAPVDRERVLVAARAARRWWEVAGTWLEVERAEYRLALSHLAAGRPDGALEHALACRRIVAEHGDDAFERVFAHEALARALRAGGDLDGARAQAGAAREAAGRVDPGSRAGAEETVSRLESSLAT